MDSEAISRAIREKRASLGWSQEKLVEESDTDQTTVSRVENGQFKRLSDGLVSIVRALDLVLPDIDPSFTAPIPSIVDETGRSLIRSAEPEMALYGTAEGGSGALIFSSEPLEFMPRPPILLRAPEAYAVLIKGESMVPAFRPGDIAFVNPNQPAGPDTDVIVQREDEGTRYGIVKTLIRATDTELKLKQWNKPKEFTVKCKDWPKCHLVVGKYSRR